MSTTTHENELDPALFTATVTSLTHSFGDNTRRKIYLFLREHPGSTATELSRHCLVHANVVRHHLERLTESGYVTFDNVHKTTVGRPAKGYRVVDSSLAMDGSMRRDALLVALLEMALERLGPEASEAMAHDVGVEYGRTLAGTVGSSEPNPTLKAAMASIATSSSPCPVIRRAVFGARPSSARIAPEVRSRARNSSTCPSKTKTVMTAAASKYTAPAPCMS